MIVNKPPKRKQDQSSFSKLAKYISRDDTIKNGEGLRITNCNTDALDMACMEIADTQAMNTRTKKDKTYHLVVSFPEGERPTPDQLEDIEHELCKSIGFEDHQRISAVHDDTDNFHFHIAINRIHPETFNINNQRYDFNTLNATAAELEQKHQLTEVCSAQGKTPATQKHDLIRAHTGQQTFKDYVQENRQNITDVIDQAANWQQCQEKLSEQFGLSIKKKGNGASLVNDAGAGATKLSDLGREYTAGKLSKRLGAFQALNSPATEPKQKYSAPPAQKSAANSPLWDEFQQRQKAKQKALTQVKTERGAVFENLAEQSKTKRAAIKRDGLLRGRQKFNAYKRLTTNIRRAREEQTDVFFKRRQAVYEQFPERNWQDFLIKQAENGNTDALKMLRKGKQNNFLAKKLSLTSKEIKDGTEILKQFKPEVRPSGNVVYTVNNGKTKITDTGSEFTTNQTDSHTINAALRMARQRHGDHLTITGTEEFKQKVVEVAVAEGMKITFTDDALERKRQALEAATSKRYGRKPPEPAQPQAPKRKPKSRGLGFGD